MSLSSDELDELTERRPLRLPEDPLSETVGSPAFVHRHRFPELFVTTPAGRSPRLTVSRYYWDADPPLAIDFRRDLKLGLDELNVKREYFAQRDIRYMLLADQWDVEGAESALRQFAPTETLDPATKPLSAPRRPRARPSSPKQGETR